MIKVILSLTLLLSAMPASAISRYTSTAMSCGEIQARIRADGAAIMQYRSHAQSKPSALWPIRPERSLLQPR